MVRLAEAKLLVHTVEAGTFVSRAVMWNPFLTREHLSRRNQSRCIYRPTHTFDKNAFILTRNERGRKGQFEGLDIRL